MYLLKLPAIPSDPIFFPLVKKISYSPRIKKKNKERKNKKDLRTDNTWLLITHLLYIFTIWMRHRIGGMGWGKRGAGDTGIIWGV